MFSEVVFTMLRY